MFLGFCVVPELEMGGHFDGAHHVSDAHVQQLVVLLSVQGGIQLRGQATRFVLALV